MGFSPFVVIKFSAFIKLSVADEFLRWQPNVFGDLPQQWRRNVAACMKRHRRPASIRVPKLPVVAFRLCLFNRWTAGVGQFNETVRFMAPDGTTVLVGREVLVLLVMLPVVLLVVRRVVVGVPPLISELTSEATSSALA